MADVIDTGWLVVIKGHKTVVDTNQLAIVAILFIFTFTPITNINKLEAIHRAAARFCFNDFSRLSSVTAIC